MSKNGKLHFKKNLSEFVVHRIIKCKNSKGVSNFIWLNFPPTSSTKNVMCYFANLQKQPLEGVEPRCMTSRLELSSMCLSTFGYPTEGSQTKHEHQLSGSHNPIIFTTNLCVILKKKTTLTYMEHEAE